jgi:hypothetical protein
VGSAGEEPATSVAASRGPFQRAMSHWPRRLLAAAIAAAIIAIVACDLWVGAFRDWWDRHSITGSVIASLLVLGVTAVIVDEVLARRQRRERATSVAVQALIVYLQAVRAYEALAGDNAEAVGEEMRSLASMLLTASPNLFDDPQARIFLENVQRLAGTMVRAAPSAQPTGGDSADQQSRLAAAMSAVQASRIPLLARLSEEYRATVEESA